MSFCCTACEEVHAAIDSLGLGRFYELRDRLPGERRPALRRARGYEEFDDAAFERLHVRTLPSGARRVELFLEGVHCPACLWLVERIPHGLPGVRACRLDLGRSRAIVDWDPAEVRLSGIARRLDELGHPPHPFRGGAAARAAEKERRDLWVRLAISGACAGNVMLISFALYGGLFHGIEEEYRRVLRAAALLVSLPALIWGGGWFLRSACSALRRGRLHIDLPVSVGIVAGAAHGAWSTLAGRGELYLDSVTMLIFLLLGGRLLERGLERRAAEAAELLHSLAPARARRIDAPEGERDLPLEALLPGMRVRVLAGETVPVDGTVRAGRSELDRSRMTGESRPVPVAPGERVEAGATNLAAALEIEVEQVGEESRLGRLLASMEESARRRAPIVRLADRLAGIFVAAVLLGALATALIAWPDGPGAAIDRALALLIVTCPCALALATPLAVSASLGRAARRGILVRGGDVLERLRRPGTIWFDKTGTLTRGRAERIAWEGDAALERAVAALEREVAHPLAEALRAPVEGPVPDATEVAPLEGGGVRGTVDGKEILVGAPRAVLAAIGAPTDHPLARAAAAHAAAGLTPVLVARDGALSGLAAVGDALRPEAESVISAFRARGWRVGILSGDDPATVAAVGARLGIPPELSLGGRTPEEKLAAIEAGAAAEPTAMVGDGVNDAAALAAATVGIAIQGGAEAALRAADAFVLDRRLAGVADLLEGALGTVRTIRLGFAFSIFYNAIGAALAVSGHLHPLVAAVAMPLSSLTVLAIAWCARSFPVPASREEPAPTTVGPRAPELPSTAPGGEPLPCR